jgi:hypothetical protein
MTVEQRQNPTVDFGMACCDEQHCVDRSTPDRAAPESSGKQAELLAAACVCRAEGVDADAGQAGVALGVSNVITSAMASYKS